MYNTEKYIGACLMSILSQTFQNFEVIVVDDCSTDNSCAIVESFIPKFGGRLKLFHTKINSGGPGEPSNKGVYLSRGKYIYIVDNDDLLVNRALEILFGYAEKYDADIVNMSIGFVFSRNSDKPFPNREDVKIIAYQVGAAPNKTNLESEDLQERVKKISRDELGRSAWQKFVRRDLLLDNEITFPNLGASQDIAWVIQVFSLAKRILTISEPLYVYRFNSNSITRRKKTTEQRLNFWTEIIAGGLKFLLNFFNKNKNFRENPAYQCALMEYWIRLHGVGKTITKMPLYEVYEIIKNNFEEKFGEYGKSLAYLCISSIFYQFNFMATSKRIAQLENQVRELQQSK